LEHTAFRAAADPQAGFDIDVGRMEPERSIRAAALVLATGRFMGGGLQADRHAVREPLFNLPVRQPELRDHWHRENFLDRRGHPVAYAGLETDECLRPLGTSGRPAHPRLFAAGSILANQDWMRMKCGSGLAIATAYAAVARAASELKHA